MPLRGRFYRLQPIDSVKALKDKMVCCNIKHQSHMKTGPEKCIRQRNNKNKNTCHKYKKVTDAHGRQNQRSEHSYQLTDLSAITQYKSSATLQLPPDQHHISDAVITHKEVTGRHQSPGNNNPY